MTQPQRKAQSDGKPQRNLDIERLAFLVGLKTEIIRNSYVWRVDIIAHFIAELNLLFSSKSNFNDLLLYISSVKSVYLYF